MLKQIKDCTIDEVMDYIENKTQNYDVRDVSINTDRSVTVEYWNNRGELKYLELEADKKIRR